MILHQVEVKEWLNSRSSCAKVNSWSGLDPEQTFLAMQQEREYAGSLMLVTSRGAIAYVSS